MTASFARRSKDSGFTLVELLVTMVIIAVLAAIMIPIFLNQREKASDTAARSDVVNLGQMILSAQKEGDPVLDVQRVGDTYEIDGEFAMPASDGVVLVTFAPVDETAWCLQMSHPQGDTTVSPGVRYDATEGFAEGIACP
ncbi:type II secretion system protein [Demequina sp. NBRC 110052]|uniref:type II secretion system protein n=1 Tax=Demequina sp. NBRC 110052 TaxID=1570341 RepID=UPI00190EE436|nr:type II secretion system protein [Demequina sp. NBRC 110052]